MLRLRHRDLLPRLIRGRQSAPVFLSAPPRPCLPPCRQGPVPGYRTGPARLRPRPDPVHPLHRVATAPVRHSAATHLGEQGIPLQLIMAKTRHRNPRTAMRYVRPGAEAVAEITTLLKPPRRRS